jgi:RNA polymerase sigma-70 factor (ECF subfamily)
MSNNFCQNQNSANKSHVEKMAISPVLLQELREGKHFAYEEIYLHYASSIKKFLTVLTRSKETAKELTQEVFITLWEKRENIDPNNNIVGYLYVIAKNLALKHFRDNKIIFSEEFHHRDNLLLDIAPDEILLAKEKKILTEITIRKMPPQRRKIYELSRKEGLTNREIAERLCISKNTVENHITSALKDLRNVVTF